MPKEPEKSRIELILTPDGPAHNLITTRPNDAKTNLKAPPPRNQNSITSPPDKRPPLPQRPNLPRQKKMKRTYLCNPPLHHLILSMFIRKNLRKGPKNFWTNFGLLTKLWNYLRPIPKD